MKKIKGIKLIKGIKKINFKKINPKKGLRATKSFLKKLGKGGTKLLFQYVLMGLILVLIIFIAIDIFTGFSEIKEREAVFPSPVAQLEDQGGVGEQGEYRPEEFPVQPPAAYDHSEEIKKSFEIFKEAKEILPPDCSDFQKKFKQKGDWRLLASFSGVENEAKTTPVLCIPSEVRWRIRAFVGAENFDKGTLYFLVYPKERGPASFIEDLTKDVIYDQGVAEEIVEICDTSGGEYLIKVNPKNVKWIFKIEVFY